MDTSKLIEYLSIIIDLEKDKYSQSETIKQLNKNIKSYTNEYRKNENFNEQVLSNCSTEHNVQVDKSGKGIMYFMVYYVGFLGMSLGALSEYIFHNRGLSVLIGIIGGIIGGSIPVMVWKHILKERRKQAVIQRNQSMRADVELSQNRQTRNKEISVILPRIKGERDIMQKSYNLTCETLQKCYDINIIPSKYRSLIPVGMFYDYLINRRTYSLERNPNTADEGAINMYENECFKRLIISKFDQLLDKLDEISGNQRVIYNAIQEGKRQTQSIMNDINKNVSKVNSNLRTIQYQNERRDKCLQYMSYVTYQRYMSK